jgi:hypothetical protein
VADTVDLADIYGPDLTAQHVEGRVDDWLARLDDLLRRIETWALGHGWQVEDRACVPMDEELMRRFGLPPRQQPALELRSGHGGKVWIRPRALWVIGANGRVDIYATAGVGRLVDVAEPFSTPDWRFYRLGQDAKGRAFTPEMLDELD